MHFFTATMPIEDLFTTDNNPSLLVFDCDWTIWPFDCDKDVIAPFSRSPNGGVFDYYSRGSNPYLEVPAIFSAAVKAGIPVAFLSRNPSAGPVEALLRSIEILPRPREEPMFLWDAMPSREYFHCYSTNGFGNGKDLHFANLKKATGIPFSEMLFFDDLPANIDASRAQGTVSVQVKSGVNERSVAAGLIVWRERKAKGV